MIVPSQSERWIRAVEQLAPPLGPLSYLRVTFRPDWGRWCVWQMIPPAAIPALMWAKETPLQGSVEGGFFRVQPDRRARVLLERDHTTQYGWDLYRETGCYAQPFWIVQGRRGGHKWQFTHEESVVSRMHGGPKAPPAPGSLPYASVDQRVLHALAPFDELPRWNRSAKLLHERDERDLDAQERDQLYAHRVRLWQWLEGQVEETFDGVRVSKRRALGGDLPMEDPDVIHEQFLTED